MRFSRQEYWSGLPLPSPVDHVLSKSQTQLSDWTDTDTDTEPAIFSVSGFLNKVTSLSQHLISGLLAYGAVSRVSLDSVQFSHSVVSNSLRPHGLQHARLCCPSPTPSACSNSCPSSQWCHPTISSSIISFSSCLKSLPVSGSFPMSQFFVSDGHSIGASASASVLPMNIQDCFPLELVGSPCSSRDSEESSPTPQFKSINSLALCFLHGPTLTSMHDYWKNHSLY